MIVRIATEGQYRLPSALLDRLSNLDNSIVGVVAAGDQDEFYKLYSEMVDLVRKQGELLKPDEIVESEVILPPPDITLEEARRLFSRAELVPDASPARQV